VRLSIPGKVSTVYARVVSADLREADVERFVRAVNDQVIPRLRDLQGFKGGYWLVDHETGRGLGVTLFESKAALDATEEQANRIREEASRNAGLTVPSFEHYEVVASISESEAQRRAA
jgi:hypothetical protein